MRFAILLLPSVISLFGLLSLLITLLSPAMASQWLIPSTVLGSLG
jgi:hypothetical protein